MSLIPTMRVTRMTHAIDFYTRVLDFDHVGTWPAMADPAFTFLSRGGDELHLSSHDSDGVCGQAVAVIVDDADALFATFCARGLAQAHRTESPVHLGPTDQSWGTREFYVDDPDGNTLRFVQR